MMGGNRLGSPFGEPSAPEAKPGSTLCGTPPCGAPSGNAGGALCGERVSLYGETCVRVFRKDTSAALPLYATPGAAGADVTACIPADIVLQPGERKKIAAGLVLEIPPGWEAQVRPRSGLALKYGITVLNAPGTIDSDYRGEVEIILINLGEEPYTLRNGDRIAQLVFAPAPQLCFEEAAELGATQRGGGGFGSTGIDANGAGGG